MIMDRSMKNIQLVKKIARGKNLLLLAAGLLVSGVYGCASQPDSITSPSAMPRGNGLSLAGKFRAVVIDDLDNDGNLDVVGGASSPGMVTINYGDGKGGISRPLQFPIRGDVRSVDVTDINEDGLADIVFAAQKPSSGIKVWMNQSRRQWKLTRGPIEINNYEGIKTADVNGDGHMDIIAANATSATQGGIQVWLGDGRGNWPVESGPTVSGIFMDVYPVDLNHDGNLDLIGAGWGTYGALRVWLGDGTGSWSSGTPIDWGSFYGLSIGDLNQDGHFDILAGSYKNGIRIFSGNGLGDFAAILTPDEYLTRAANEQPKIASGLEQGPQSKKNPSFWTVLALDLDQDGLEDLLAGSLDSEGIKAWRNLGQGRWSRIEGVFPSSGSYYEMVAGDLDADARLDVCAASSGEGIKIWPGGEGTLKIVEQHRIERAESSEDQTRLQSPLENDVYKTINGVAEYKINSGDILEITLWEGTTPIREEIRVRPDGRISFGFVEDLYVNAMTFSQLDQLLTTYLKEYVKNPRIDVAVIKKDSKFVRLVGAIASSGQGTGPGRYPLTGKTTALEMITQYGGVTKDANLGDIRIRRKNGQSISLDFYKAINKGDLSQDLVLDDDDLVFVPTLAQGGHRVYVFGEVEKPGAYTFAGSGMRLFDAVSEAGGATVFASTANTRVVRGDPASPEIITADLKSLIEEGNIAQNVALASGDMVYVPRSGWGDINLYNKRIRPLFELILWPARTVIDWYNAADIISTGGTD